MKKFRFSEKDSVFKSADLGYVAKYRFNWDRFLFLSALVGVSFWLISVAFENYFVVEARGQVKLKSQEIFLYSDIFLDSLMVKEGDLVEKGDVLFRYKFIELNELSGTRVLKMELEDKRIRELRDLKLKINLKQEEVTNLNSMLNRLESKFESYKKLLVLNAISLEEYNSLDFQIQMYRDDIRLLQYEITRLNGTFSALSMESPNDFEQEEESVFFRAKSAGIVSTIHTAENSYVSKSNPVLSSVDQEFVAVNGYFDMKYRDHILPKKEVKVIFPSGDFYIGFIEKVFVSTTESPEEFQKKHEPTSRYIVAEIHPKYSKDRRFWAQHDKILLDLRLIN